ncbi:THUMP domain-containing protein [Candidatus Bathyarchaeota archaeon]|nr:THUMP domain-containing protein [Candidatus Bathyarchaeota archaeon]
MYDFNLIVSCPWNTYVMARNEIANFLKSIGDEKPFVERTIARGIIGVKTSLDPRQVIQNIRDLIERDSLSFQYTLKWVPIDLWTFSDIDSIKRGVIKLKDRIQKGEKWRMTVEKRRYTCYHKIEIIEKVAELINEKVDLKNPDKILHIEIIGKYAGLSLLTPKDVYSIAKFG